MEFLEAMGNYGTFRVIWKPQRKPLARPFKE